MTLYARNGWYWCKWMRGGRVHYRALHTQNKRQAKDLLTKIRLAEQAPTFDAAVEILRMLFEAGGGEGGASLPLEEAWARYEEVAKSVGRDKVAEKTARMRRERFAAFVKWAQKEGLAKTVEAVNGRVAAAYAAALAKSGLKAKTRQNTIGDLSGIWRLLEKTAPALRNPWTGLAPRDTDGERLPPFTTDEERRVMEAAEKVGKGWPLACMVARHTGLRYGDIATLEWEDVDFVRAVIRRTPNKTARHGVTVTIPLALPLYDALKAAKAAARKGERFVLPDHAMLYGDKGRGAFALLNFREVLDAAGLEGTRHTFHSWRHTFRTRLAAAGVDTETAMRLCGHTNAAMSGRYDHDEHLAELREAVTAAAR